jgi:S-adenosylmethionine hydrolase
MPPPLVTLTSDFGMSDGFVVAIKGIILGICPDVRLHYVFQYVPPQDINHTSFVLRSGTFPRQQYTSPSWIPESVWDDILSCW